MNGSDEFGDGIFSLVVAWVQDRKTRGESDKAAKLAVAAVLQSIVNVLREEKE